MRIKMLTSIAGGELTARPGEIVECEAGLAERLIASEQAERVRGKAEAATAAPAETAVDNTGRPRGKRKRGGRG